MEREFIRNQLYKRYIEPTKKERKEYIGVEIEVPIINLEKKAVDFETVHRITHRFIKQFDFTATGIDDNGNINSATTSLNGDILSYDCSYNNLELSFGKENNLYNIKKDLTNITSFCKKSLTNTTTPLRVWA